MEDLNDKITGGQLSADEWNQVPSEMQNIITATGQSLTSADLNQLGKGVSGYVACADYYSASGSANAIVLSAIGSIQAPPAYMNGMEVRFKASASNTGVVTVNVATLGVKKVNDQFDAPLIAGDLVASSRYTLTYDPSFDGGLGAFALQKDAGAVVLNALSRNYIDGFILSNNTAATPASDLDISAGQCKDVTNGYDFDLTGSLGKRITAAWAEGGTPAVPVGGMPIGVALTNNTWYRVFAIQKATGQVDVGFDTNSGASTLLNGTNAGALGYTEYRQIGWIRYGTAIIEQFVQTGSTFRWMTDSINFGATLTVGNYTHTAKAPPLTTAMLNAKATSAGADSVFRGFWIGTTSQTPPSAATLNSTTASPALFAVQSNQAFFGSGSIQVVVDSNSQYTMAAGSTSAVSIIESTVGWIDLRGRQ